MACELFRSVSADELIAEEGRLRFCTADADMIGDAEEIKLVVMTPMYCVRVSKET